MGKSLVSQRRGKGSPTFRNQRKGIKTRYYNYDSLKAAAIKGHVIDLIKERGRNSIVAKTLFENGEIQYSIAAEGLFVGDEIMAGNINDFDLGYISMIKSIPEGCPIFNIEKKPGDGGTIVKSAGCYALLVSKDNENAVIKLPSGKTINVSLKCRATIGRSAAGGRLEKPFVKAGTARYAMKAKTRKYCKCRGVAKNAVDHPFGGSQHHAGKSKSTARNAPPGRKVGSIAAKRTGRVKK